MAIFSNSIIPAAAAAAAPADVVTKSLRFNSTDSPYLNLTFAAGNRTTWTFSAWVKRAELGTRQIVFASRSSSGTSRFYLEFTAGNGIEVSQYGPAYTLRLITTAVYRDVGSWYHIVFKYDSTPSTPSSTSISLYVNGTQVTSFSTATYPAQNVTTSINSAVRHTIGERADLGGSNFGGYLADVYFTDATAYTATSFAEEDATTGQWKPKAFSGTYGTNGFHLAFENLSNLGLDSRGSGGVAVSWDTSKYRASKPTPSWSQSDTQFDGVSGHVQHSISVFSGNGKYYAEFDISSASTLGGVGVCPATWWTGTTLESYLHTQSAGCLMQGDGDLVTPNSTESTSFDYTKRLGIEVDAQANTATFYEVDGSTSTLLYAADSTDGLDFADNVAWGASVYDGNHHVRGYFASSEWNGTPSTGYVAMPSGNHFTPTNLAASDVVNDTPTDNYAVLNPLALTHSGVGGDTFSEGNTQVVTASSGRPVIPSTIFMPPNSGTYYAEFTLSAAGAMYGIARDDVPNADDCTASSKIWGYETNAGTQYKVNSGSYVNIGTAPSYPVKNGVSYNTATGEVKFFVGGSDIGGYTGLSTAYSYGFFVGDGSTSVSTTVTTHFDSDDWDNTPSGVKQLSTGNLPTPTIAKPAEHFSTKLWTATSTNPKVLDFPWSFATDGGLVWQKMRNSSGSHHLFDTVRGDNKGLYSNSSSVENASGQTEYYTQDFDSSGDYSIQQDGVGNEVNYSGKTYVAWGWKKSASAGMDIVTWTGDADDDSTQAVSHSLGVAPELIIAKNRTDNSYMVTGDWVVHHKDLTSGDNLRLNDSSAKFTTSSTLIQTVGDNSVNFGNDSGGMTYQEYLNYNDSYSGADTYVAYLFASVEGYSKCGSYTGNGLAAGPMVTLSFRPVFILTKRIDGTSPWRMFDDKRPTYNDETYKLEADSSGAELTGYPYVDFLSNGFKIRDNGSYQNQIGGEYIFYAVGQSSKYASAR